LAYCPEPIEDERGSFARLFCRREFEAHGLNAELAQCSASFNKRKGTLRGLHFQAEPHGEDKIVRCTRAFFTTSQRISGQSRRHTGAGADSS